MPLTLFLQSQKSLFALVVISILLLFSLADGYGASANLPSGRVMTAEYLAQAKNLIESGNAEEAWGMLTRLLREDPENLELNSLLARAGFATGRDNQAVAAIERMVSLYPQSAELHLAFAKALARAGDEADAKAELEEAERLSPGISSESDKLNLEKAARAEQKKYDRLQLAGRLAVGMIWDNNPTYGLDNLDVNIGDFTLRLNDTAGRKSSTGEYLSAALNWGWHLGHDTPWYLSGDFAFYGKTFNNKKLPSNRDFTWGKATFGLRRMSEQHILDVRFRAENATFDPWDSMTAYGADISWLYAPLANLQFILRGSADSRVFMERYERNGGYWNGGAYLRWILDQNNNYSFMAGLRGLVARTNQDRWSYDGWEALARFDLTFFRKLDVSPYIGWRETFYLAPATEFSEMLGEENRRDHMFMTGLNLVWHWTENLANEIGLQYTKNHSNSHFYRYDQTQINFGLVFSF